MEMSGVYNFGPSFQEKILAVLWRDPSFYTIYNDCVKPRFFESEVHIDLARIITTFYEEYETSPSYEAVEEEVRSLIETSKVKSQQKDAYLKAIDNMMTMDLSDDGYVKDKVVQFGRKQALTQAILESVEDVQKGVDFEKVEDRINKATKVGEDIGDFGTFYFDTERMDDRMESYETRDSEKISTGNTLLDDVMRGGLGRGELGIVIAPPGTGKTLSLINFGAACKLEGRNVVHFTLEMSEERVAHRYDSNYTNKDFNYIKENRSEVASSLKTLATARNGELIIKEYPTRTCTVSKIKSYLTSLKLAKGIEPDLVIIDYPDLMKPSRNYNERRTELELLYEELRGLAQEFNCAIWGASQTNRGALAKEVITIGDLAESFGKAAVADFMIALSQTKEEKARNELRYYVAKSRNGQSDTTLHFDVFYDRMRIVPNDTRQMAFAMSADDATPTNSSGGSRAEREARETQKNENEVATNIIDAINKSK